MNDIFYQLDIAAFIIGLVLFIVNFSRKSYPTLTRRIFKVATIFTMLMALFESCEVLVWKNAFPIHNSHVYALIESSTELVHFTFHYICLFYVISLVKGNSVSKSEKTIFSIFYLLTLLFIITNPLHHMLYVVNSDLTLTFSYGEFILTAIYVSFTICSISILIRFRRKTTKALFVTTLIFFIVSICSSIVEALSGYYILVENFFTALTFIMVTTIIDNPERYFVEHTSIYNELAFNDVFSAKLEKNNEFTIMAFAYHDFDLYIQKFGKKRANVAIRESLINCAKKYGRQNVFLLGRNVIAIDAKGLDIEEEAKQITISSYKGGIAHNPELKLNAEFVVVNCPNDVNSLTNLHDAIYIELFNGELNNDTNITYFDKSKLESKYRQEKILMRLHDAIENDGFVMNYQPLYDWKKGSFVALEALIRFKLKEDDEEYISPAEFIPIAEENGLIFDIDEIVFEKVCRFIRNNDIAKLGINFVDINLSLLKLLDSSTVARYSELVSRYEINPAMINLEITETAEADEKYLNTVRQNIATFREAGFNFSLDDYGSGYSTVVYMAEMDAKIVKIDASILRNAMKNKKYYTVLENCVRLVYCFDKECVVEGVETEQMVETLKRLGVDYFQGYYYSKPLTEDNIISFLIDKNKIGGGYVKREFSKISQS